MAISTAAIVVRFLAPETPPLAIATWRMLIGSLLFAWALPRSRHWVRQHPGLWVLAGSFLGLHFATWITSLFFTTVASSVVLVTTTPVFTSLWEALRRQLTRPRETAGVVLLVMVGMGMLAGGDLALSGRALVGDALALLGAFFAAGYLLAGRSIRARVGALTYVAPVYALAALVLLGLAGLGHVDLRVPSPRAWALLIFLAVVPQGIGHTLINWGLGQRTATTVSLLILGEPVLSGIWAWLLFQEVPPPLALGGMGLILLGLGVHLAREGSLTERGEGPSSR